MSASSNDHPGTQSHQDPRTKPWDARIAARLVRPLINSPIHPNVLTTIRLAVGCVAIALCAQAQFNLGALAFALSNFLDHTDGELARLSGKTSQFGHRYDLLSDAIVNVGIFIGLGLGLTGELGNAGVVFGLLAGIAIAGIFQLRHIIEKRHGKSATRQAQSAGFEVEDILYLMPLITLAGLTKIFLCLAAIGAPIGLIVVLFQFIRIDSATDEDQGR